MHTYQPSPSELAVLVVVMIQRYSKDRGREVTRFRIARNSLRRLAVRNRLHDSFIEAWADNMALDHRWLVFVDDEEFLLQRKDVVKSWTKIASKRCDDLVKRLQRGDASAITDAENEIEDVAAIDDDESED